LKTPSAGTRRKILKNAALVLKKSTLVLKKFFASSEKYTALFSEKNMP